MAKTTLSSLITSAGYLLETTLGTTSDPTKAEVTAWINEAQRDIAVKCPWYVLKDLMVESNPSIAAVSVVAWNTIQATVDYVKFCYATLCPSGTGDALPVRLVTPEVAAMAVTNNLVYDASNPIMWFDATNVNFLPATPGGAGTGKLKFYFIRQPADLSGDSDTISVPEEFSDAVVYYAAAKCRAQEEEWQQYAQLMQLYNEQLLSIINMYKRFQGVGNGSK
jgi:hypothetical protein